MSVMFFCLLSYKEPPFRLAGFFLAAKVWLTCGLHTPTGDKFPSCRSPLISFPTRQIPHSLLPTAKPSSSNTYRP